MDPDARTLTSPQRAPLPPAQRPCPECGGQRIAMQLRVSAKTPLDIDVRMAGIEGMEWQPGWPGLSWALLCAACGAVSLFARDPREVVTHDNKANRR